MAIDDKATEFAGLPVIDYRPAVGLVLPTMSRRVFQRDDGNGDTFWAVSLEQNRLTIESGSAGGARETDAQVFPDATAARNEYGKFILSLIKEGYAEQKSHGSSTREALISALAADPDDHVSRMAFADYLSEQGEQLPAAAYRVDQQHYDDEVLLDLESLLADPAVGLVQAIVIGWWGDEDSTADSKRVVETLIAARGRLTSLRALFLGDITWREDEISWIHQSDLTDLLLAFPNLEHFRARGGIDLDLGKLRHEHLKSLVFEASNLPREVVRALGEADLPALEHLEIWLGTRRYGANTEAADLEGILQGKLLPSLRYLGIRNSEIADDVACALATAPVLKRLRVLDLSLGNLSDRGAEALWASPAVVKLERLDIHHHYVSLGICDRLLALGVQLDASESKEADEVDDPDDRYVAHME